MTDEVTDLAAAVKSAHRAVTLALVAVMIAVVVLAIDHSIKRAIVEEAERVRVIVDEFKQAVRDGTVAGETGTGSSGSHESGNRVAGSPGAPTPANPDANGAPASTRNRVRRTTRGQSGDA